MFYSDGEPKINIIFLNERTISLQVKLSVLSNTNDFKQDNGESKYATISTKVTDVTLTFNDLEVWSALRVKSEVRSPSPFLRYFIT